MALAYQASYKLPIIMTRSNNVYGPRQFPEKLSEWRAGLSQVLPLRTAAGTLARTRHTHHKIGNACLPPWPLTARSR
jgi:nucleoside-diphosphate-sugar epimerase